MGGIGSYLTSTLSVPEGDVGTAAAYVAVFPDGSTQAGSGTGGPTSFEAVIGPMPSSGWGLTAWTVTGPGAGAQRSRWFVTPSPTAYGVWPPTINDLKLDLSRDGQKYTSDEQLEMDLSAAIAYVRDRKSWQFDIGAESPESDSGSLLTPDADFILGTIRLAGRWHARRRSQDGTINMGEQGIGRVAAYDPDIERMLRMGRKAPMSFA